MIFLITMAVLGFVALSLLFAIILIRFLGIRNAEYALNEIENRQGFTQVIIVLVMVITCGVYVWQGSTAYDTEQRSLRAYIHLSPRHMCISANPAVDTTIDFDVVNDGQTPAHDVTVVTKLIVVPNPTNNIDFDISVDPQATGGNYLGPHCSFALVSYLPTEALSLPELMDINVGSRRVCMLAEVRYADVFGNIHYLRFCATENGDAELKMFLNPTAIAQRFAGGNAVCDYPKQNNYEY